MQNLITIHNVTITQDSEGRFCLNDLHKAAGGENKHRPKYWLETQQAAELVIELTKGGIPPLEQNQPLKVIHGGNSPGTYVVKELVYAYAMWISAKFHLEVIRAYDALVTLNKQFNLNEISDTARAADTLASIFGLTGNQKLLSVDRVVKKITGTSPLKLLEVTLIAEHKEQLITPTDIGLALGLSPMNANKVLEKFGYQVGPRDFKGRILWEPTAKGRAWSEMLDTGKAHENGTPIKQLKWKSSIVDELLSCTLI